MRRISLAVLAGLVALCASAPTAGAFGVYGIKQNDSAGFNSISGDGRYVAFETYATNLGPGDADALRDIYVRNTETGVTVLASRATGANGAKGNAESQYPYMSANGRYVAFQSRASNFDPADTDTRPDVYVRDLVAETTTLVSRASGIAGVDGNGDSQSGGMSADGRYAVFSTNSNNIDPADPDGDATTRTCGISRRTRTLVSRASGSSGAKADRGGSGYFGLR